MAHILAVSNQKGGVGKTTTAVNLSASLAEAGQRVLVVDLDPQGSASSGLGHSRNDVELGVTDILLERAAASDAIVASTRPGLELLPADADLIAAELSLVSEIGRERRLRRALEPLREEYDFIVLDCPPSLGLLTVNALAAADAVLVPLQAEYYAIEGMRDLLRTIEAVQRHLNPDLRREGILITMTDTRNNLCRDVEAQARQVFGGEVFDTLIPRNVRLGEAPSHGLSVIDYAPRSSGATAYQSLAEELLGRHGLRRAS